MLYAAAKQISHIALESGEQVRIRGIYDEDQDNIKMAYLLPFTQGGVKALLHPEAVQGGTSMERWVKEYTKRLSVVDDETGQAMIILETLLYNEPSRPLTFVK